MLKSIVIKAIKAVAPGAAFLAILISVPSCGGGGTSASTGAGATNLPMDQSVQAPLLETVKDLRSVSTAMINPDGSVTFSSDPGLSNAEVFIVGNQAFKVANVARSFSGTLITTSPPTLAEVAKDIIFTGTFDPSTTLPKLAAKANPIPHKLAQETKVFLATRDGVSGFVYETKATSVNYPSVYFSGEIFVGYRKAEAKSWSVKSNGGSYNYDIVIKPKGSFGVGRSDKGPNDGTVCSSPDPKGVRVLLFTVPLIEGVAAALQMPVCLAFNVKSDFKYEMLKLDGEINVLLKNGEGQTSPTATITRNSLVATIPSTDTMVALDRADLGGTGQVLSAEVSAQLTLEASLQVSMLAIVSTGIASQFGAEGKVSAEVAPAYVSESLGNLDVDPTACVKASAYIVGQVSWYADSFFSKKALARKLYEYKSEDVWDKKFGFGPSCSKYLEIDPRGTWLVPGSADLVNAPVFIDLASLSLSSGDRVRVLGEGNFSYGPGFISGGITAMFLNQNGAPIAPNLSGTAAFLYTTPDCGAGSPAAYRATDSPFDFGVGNGSFVEFTVPVGASRIVFATGDCYFRDNSQGIPPLAVRVRKSNP
jgi:hypothetical protein